EEATPLLRPGAPGAELALRMRPAAHTTGLVFALHVDCRLSGHLREVFGRVPVVDSERLEDVHVGEECGPGLSVGAFQLREILDDQPERDTEPAGEPDVALHGGHASEVRVRIE